MSKKNLSIRNTLKSSALFAFFIGCGIGFTAYSTVSPQWFASTTEKAVIRACFSPEGHCTNLIVSAIKETKSSILVAAYSFTSPQIANALVKAHEEGVEVKILVDKSQLKEKHSQIPFLIQKGLTVYIDPAKGLAHNKIMIFDNRYVLTGSFNFTRAAESRNAENVLLIDDTSLALVYKNNWENRASSLIPLSWP
ncbi:MAG: hypothetical protein BGO67_07240 [Alphaproteobacteria bacterium 41-28]|nr:MAG: hypothetical protein BGO67_07240 [Alphaproteobacteria bacterium 41-28]